MNLAEMHILFRQFAQQMGMQNVRAILPEQIDLLLNTSISDTINRIITQSVNTENYQEGANLSRLSQINTLSFLYKTVDLNFIKLDNSDDIKEFDVYQYNNDETIKPLYWIDFSIKYSKIHKAFPIRLVDEIYLSENLNDFVLKPTYKSPILVSSNNNFDLYLPSGNTYDLEAVKASYIKEPNKVKFDKDETQIVETDLPPYMHVDIVKQAVSLWKVSINNDSQNRQQPVSQ